MTDPVTRHKPDLLYADDGLPFGVTGRTLVANSYNRSIENHGTLEAVYDH